MRVPGPDAEAGRPLAGSPAGDRRDRVQVPHRDAVDGPARAFRLVEGLPTTGFGCGRPTALGRRSSPPCSLMRMPRGTWTGSSRSTPPSSALTGTLPGAVKRRPGRRGERPCPWTVRGGLTTKIHLAADGQCRPLAFVITPGRAGDAPAFTRVMAWSRVPRRVGRPRVTPETVLADKAYSSRAIRRHLRRRGIRAVNPQPADQAANRKRLRRLGGRRPATASIARISRGRYLSPWLVSDAWCAHRNIPRHSRRRAPGRSCRPVYDRTRRASRLPTGGHAAARTLHPAPPQHHPLGPYRQPRPITPSPANHRHDSAPTPTKPRQNPPHARRSAARAEVLERLICQPTDPSE